MVWYPGVFTPKVSSRPGSGVGLILIFSRPLSSGRPGEKPIKQQPVSIRGRYRYSALVLRRRRLGRFFANVVNILTEETRFVQA